MKILSQWPQIVQGYDIGTEGFRMLVPDAEYPAGIFSIFLISAMMQSMKGSFISSYTIFNQFPLSPLVAHINLKSSSRIGIMHLLSLFRSPRNHINSTHYRRFSFLCKFQPDNTFCPYYVCLPPARSFRSFLSVPDHIHVSFYISLYSCLNAVTNQDLSPTFGTIHTVTDSLIFITPGSILTQQFSCQSFFLFCSLFYHFCNSSRGHCAVIS